MKTCSTLVAILAAASLLVACGSDSGTGGGTVTTPTDSGSSSGGGDAGASSGGTDAGGTTDTGSSSGGADAGGSSGGTVDAGPTKPKKCQPADQLCIQGCAAQQCKKEETACTNDTKCAGFVQCIGGCAQGQEPPGNPEGATCPEKCRNIAGKDAVDLYLKLSNCTLNECVEINKCETTLPQQQFQQCANLCGQAKCLLPAQECEGDKKCAWVGQCVTDCQANKNPPWPPADHKVDPAWLPGGVTPTTCAGKCFSSVPFETYQRFLTNLICLQSQCMKQPYTTPCPQTNIQCINACALDKCDTVFGSCGDEPACGALFACLNLKACGQDSACVHSCQKYAMDKYGAADANSAVGTYQNISQCAVSQCVGGF